MATIREHEAVLDEVRSDIAFRIQQIRKLEEEIDALRILEMDLVEKQQRTAEGAEP